MYLRQSKDRQKDEAAVSRQESACRALAEAKGITQLTMYSDNDRSASKGERPEFEKLVQAVEDGKHDVLLVFHLDRLTRSIRDLTRVIEAGQPHRLNIASVHGVGIDLGDPTGVAVATILTAVAAMEVQHKGIRQRAANRQRAEAGKAFWTRRPFGYDRTKNGEVFVIEEEADAIRRGARMLLDGASTASIARDWNAAGLGASTGERKDWSVRTVKLVLLNPRYIGRRMYNNEDVGEGEWDPILDRETFDAVETILRDPRRRTTTQDRNVKYLLTGLLTCGKCGERLFSAPVKYKGRLRMQYKCFGGYCMGRGMEDIDEVVVTTLLARLSRPDAAKAFATTGDLPNLRAKATDLRARRDALAVLLADGLMSATAVREQAGRISMQLEEVEAEINRADSNNPLTAVIGSDDVAGAWKKLSVVSQREIVRTLMEITILPAGKGIRFAPDQVKIEWKKGI